MSSSIKNLNQTLAFHLEGVYEVVRHLQTDLSKCSRSIGDPETRAVFNDYRRCLEDQRLKLKRIFGYLLAGPYGRKMNHPFAKWDEIAGHDMLPGLRDILFGTTLQEIIRYMITVYTDARYIAMRLDLNPVIVLLDEILDEEEKFAQKAKRLTSTQINQACLLATN
jgi:ferritin-like metal-binding protein YciE